MAPVPLLQIDAFTAIPYGGNPAAVCLLNGPAEAAWMQRVAAEMNLSETAFIHPEGGAWALRWFTPVCEVELCGHATLAAAHALWEERLLPASAEARFSTLSGALTARRKDDGIVMDFPAEPARPVTPPDGLLDALGAAPVFVGRNRMDYLVQVATEDEVRALRPDFGRLGKLGPRGAIVTARAEAGDYDFVSRFFAPAGGVDEDPVTGSAHCCLGPFWAERLGKDELVGFQASARGGLIGVRVGHGRVLLSGQAVTVFRGELLH